MADEKTTGEKNEKQQPIIHIDGNVTSYGIGGVGNKMTFSGPVNLNIGTLPTASPDVQQKMEELVNQMRIELDKLPNEFKQDTQSVEMALEDAINEAKQEQPDKRRLEIRGDSLKRAAENLAAVAPIAVQIAKTLLLVG